MSQEVIRVLLIEDNDYDVFFLRQSLAEVPSGNIDLEHCAFLKDALARLAVEGLDFDVILLDLGLPDSQGLETFARVHQLYPRIPVVVLSGMEDVELATRAVRDGAQDYLVKGKVDKELLVRAMRYSIERMRAEETLRQARDELEVRVKERTRELAASNESLRQMVAEVKAAEAKVRNALMGTIQAMALVVEVRDPYTAGHQRGVEELACAIALRLGLPPERIQAIRLASIVHDLGKISIPAGILSKPSRLSEAEMNMIRSHPQAGYEILKQVEFPWPIARIVLQHHERMDGSGYPQGLAGPEIMLEARIIAVADVVEAMCSHRPYRPALGLDEALREISQNRGVLYDPEVVDACLHHFAAEQALPSVPVTKDQGKFDFQ